MHCIDLDGRGVEEWRGALDPLCLICLREISRRVYAVNRYKTDRCDLRFDANEIRLDPVPIIMSQKIHCRSELKKNSTGDLPIQCRQLGAGIKKKKCKKNSHF